MYIGRRRFLSQVQELQKRISLWYAQISGWGYFHVLLALFGAFELAIIGNGYDFV